MFMKEIEIKKSVEIILNEIKKLSKFDIENVIKIIDKKLLYDSIPLADKIIQHQYIIDILLIEKSKKI